MSKTHAMFAILLWVSVAVCLPGCSRYRPAETRTPAEIFCDVTGALIDTLVDDSTPDEKAFKKRRQWQYENLSAQELNELGIESPK